MNDDSAPRLVSTRLSQLEVHFQAMAEMAPKDRDGYLEEQVQDAELRRNLIELLAFDGDPATGMASLIAAEAQHASVNQVPAGTLIGAYRIGEKIADGGMGSVYLGTRADGEFEQRVAIKLLRQILPSAEAVDRFRHERQILAGLEHPGIARLLDGGTTEAHGLPYLVMELIDGVPINQYCQRQDLPVRERLHLFQKVCAAVQAAHQNLIVHRDIKPANILVDGQGQAKLLDFGVAKLVDPEADAAETLFAQQAMTPEYASPEQIRGLKITTATDVYSLGVLLYELLTGVSPYARWRGQPLDLQQAICGSEPLRPSQSGAQKEHLDTDLDHIVLKAMRKEPAQRYVSPAALAEDLQRFLDQLPVQARQGSWRYRSVKYLRRNIWPLAVSAAVVTVMLLTVGGYTLRLSEARDVAEQQRTQAQENQATAEQVSEFMAGLFNHADPTQQNPNTTAREILDVGEAKLESELADQPLVAAQLLVAMANARFGMGQYEKAESDYRRALALQRQQFSSNDPRLGDTMQAFGELLYNIEKWQEAQEMLEAALPLRAALYGDRSVEYAKSLNRISQMYQRDHRRDQFILDRLNLALEILQSQPTPDLTAISSSYFFISAWYKLRYNYKKALELGELGLATQLKVGGAHDRSMLWVEEDFGRLQWRIGDCAGAIKSFTQSIALLYEILGPQHHDSAWSWYFRGLCQQAVGDYAKAVESYAVLVPMDESRLYFGNGRYVSRTLARQAALLADLGQFEAIPALIARSESVLTDALGADSVEHFHVQFAYARYYQLQGLWDQAITHWQAYVALRRKELAPEAPQIALGELCLADTLLSAGRIEEAASLISSALPRLQAILGDSHPEYGLGLGIRARLRSAQGDIEGALADYAVALRALPTDQRNDLDVAVILEGYARQLEFAGREPVPSLGERAEKIRQHIAQAAAQWGSQAQSDLITVN